MRFRRQIIVSGLLGLLLAACAAEAERPTADMTRASTLIEQAEKAGAQQYAAAELQQARDKLHRPIERSNGKGEKAQHLAQQALRMRSSLTRAPRAAKRSGPQRKCARAPTLCNRKRIAAQPPRMAPRAER